MVVFTEHSQRMPERNNPMHSKLAREFVAAGDGYY